VNAIVAVVGPTAVGKSALAIALAERIQGEILSCDSTAVYRRIDIGTDKVPLAEQRGIRHHLVDLVEPEVVYSAAEYARSAATVARAVVDRGHVPVLVGGTGFYYRALVRGLFEGPARDDTLRARLDRIAWKRGTSSLHRWLQRVDEQAAARIQPADRKRLVRALEVYLLSGRTLTEHFSATRSLVSDFSLLTVGVRMSKDDLRPRIERRVEAQFERGVVNEVQALLKSGLPANAHALSGLVYRQVIEMLRGARSETATRQLIVQENLRYARRQMTWFRGEPNIRWIDGPGEGAPAIAEATALVGSWLASQVEVAS
jgi:tRNA dimethylallyltransferase